VVAGIIVGCVIQRTQGGIVRYADGPTVEVETTIAAPPEQVWPLVTDIDMPARFSSEFQGAQWLDDNDRPVLGARFLGRNEHPARGAWETVSIITACDAPAVFAWAVTDADHPSASWGFELNPEGEHTRLRQWAQLGPGPSGLTPIIESRPELEEKIIARRLEELRTNMAATVAGIKALAEGAG
jgi:uncharacterized protein YndB with AHSA1/START domain